jgi:hypothetical protein
VRRPKTLTALLGLALVLAGSACGKKGALLPPLSKTPSLPSDVALVQRGRMIIISWRNPTTYTDGYDLPGLSAVEIGLVEQDIPSPQPVQPPPVGQPAQAAPVAKPAQAAPSVPAAPKPPTAAEFEEQARILVRIRSDEFPGALKAKAEAKAPEAAPPVKGAPGRQAAKAKAKLKAGTGELLKYDYVLTAPKPDRVRLYFGLRAFDLRGRGSAFSGPTGFTPRVLPSPPSGLTGTVKREAIDLAWTAPSDNIDGSEPALDIKGYNVYRSVDGGPAVRINPELITGTSTVDKSFVFGQDLVYTVRAATQDAEPFWESGDSEPWEVRPEDVFPPAPPAGLTAVAGPDLISLSWEPNTETDLAGYRVWRRVLGTTDFEPLTSEPLKATTFQDTTARRGVRYEYAVTAEDLKGNRSDYSKTVTEGLKEARP